MFLELSNKLLKLLKNVTFFEKYVRAMFLYLRTCAAIMLNTRKTIIEHDNLCVHNRVEVPKAFCVVQLVIQCTYTQTHTHRYTHIYTHIYIYLISDIVVVDEDVGMKRNFKVKLSSRHFVDITRTDVTKACGLYCDLWISRRL